LVLGRGAIACRGHIVRLGFRARMGVFEFVLNKGRLLKGQSNAPRITKEASFGAPSGGPIRRHHCGDR
jgi:hypothetical protein